MAIIIYSKANCPYCDWAKQFFDRKGVAYEEIRIDLNAEKREEMMQLSGKRTVPQIFIHGQAIGGYDDLMELANKGELDNLLKS